MQLLVNCCLVAGVHVYIVHHLSHPDLPNLKRIDIKLDCSVARNRKCIPQSP